MTRAADPMAGGSREYPQGESNPCTAVHNPKPCQDLRRRGPARRTALDHSSFAESRSDSDLAAVIAIWNRIPSGRPKTTTADSRKTFATALPRSPHDCREQP